MKIKLLSFFILFAVALSSQEIHNICTAIECVDHNVEPESDYDQTFVELTNRLLIETDLRNSTINKDLLARRLEQIYSFKSLFLLRDTFEKYVHTKTDYEPFDRNIYQKGLWSNLRVLDSQITENVTRNYVSYNFTETSDKWVKSIRVSHDNDVFLFNQDLNLDRDYTGGVVIEVLTDYLKLRLANKFFNQNKILSYQSLFFAGEGYTPYIRFDDSTFETLGITPVIEDEFLSDASREELSSRLTELQEPSDRPFASFQYIGRGKFRLHYKGWVRAASYFKIGVVGGRIGERLQQVLHQDITTQSVRVLNWERQIANGGRLGINVEHNIDYLLYSSKYASIFHPNRRNTLSNHNSINLYLPVELAFGNVNTHYGFGIGVSNKAFIQTNHLNELKYKRKFVSCNNKDYSRLSCEYLKCRLRRLWQHTFLSAEIRTRKVVHNSMLHGLGFFDRFPVDRFDDENPSVYVLDESDTADWLTRIKFTLSFRLKKGTLFYQYHRFLNKEFEVQNLTEDPGLYTTPDNYGYGTIGLNIHL